jgi:putative nucleotidyltransferase with HDIG domain
VSLPELTPGIAAVSALLLGATGSMTLDIFARRRVSFMPIVAYPLYMIAPLGGYYLLLGAGVAAAAAGHALLGTFEPRRLPLRETAICTAVPLAMEVMPGSPLGALVLSGFAAGVASAALELRRGLREAAAVFSILTLAYGAMAFTMPVFLGTMALLPRAGGFPVAVTLLAITLIIWARQRATDLNRLRMDRLQRLSRLSDALLSSGGVEEYLQRLSAFLSGSSGSPGIRIVSRIPDGEGWIGWEHHQETAIDAQGIDPPRASGELGDGADGGVVMALHPDGDMALECSGAPAERLRGLDPDTRRGLAHVLYHTWQAMGHSMHQDEAFLAAAMMLARLADAKDTYTHGHSLRVASIATSLGRMFGLEGDDLRLLRVSALLHDIGKIAIPAEILTKRGLLTREERRIIERHPEEGAAIVSNLTGYEEVSRVIRSHHERLDGSGYPDGIEGSSIPFMARLVAVADTFDAITSTRSYHSDTDHRTALDTIMVGSGQQFDSRVVSMLRRALRDSGRDGAPW